MYNTFCSSVQWEKHINNSKLPLDGGKLLMMSPGEESLSTGDLGRLLVPLVFLML